MALLKVHPGDVIGVPAEKNGEWGFVLARVIRYDGVKLIEVFSDFYTNFAISEKEVLQKNFCVNNRLFNPVHASFDFNSYFGKIKWPILAKTPGYDPEQSKISEIEFEGTSYDDTGHFIKGGKDYQDPPHIRRDLEERTIYSNPQLVHHINMYLSNCVKKGQTWTIGVERSILEAKGIDWWRESIGACVTSADEVAGRFRDARKRR